MPANRLMRTALAGATGVALLAGGFGSLSNWSEEDPLPSAPVTAGELSLATGAETWTDQSPDAPDTTWNPATDEMVPGDTVRVEVPLTLTVIGKNMAGTVAIDRAAFDTTSFNGELTVTYDVGLTDLGVTDLPDGSVSFVRSGLAGDTVTGTGTVTFALAPTASLSSAEGANALLDQAKFVTTQVRPLP